MGSCVRLFGTEITGKLTEIPRIACSVNVPPEPMAGGEPQHRLPEGVAPVFLGSHSLGRVVHLGQDCMD